MQDCLLHFIANIPANIHGVYERSSKQHVEMSCKLTCQAIQIRASRGRSDEQCSDDGTYIGFTVHAHCS
jgi:hypothetical protein